MDGFSLIKSLASSLVKYGINKYLAYWVWEGTFFCVTEKDHSFGNSLTENDLKRISRNLYKEKPHTIIDDLKNQLLDLGLDDEQSNRFVDLWKKEIRDHKPDIYVLICVNDLEKEHDKTSNRLSEIQSSLANLQISLKNKISFKNIDDIDCQLKKQSKKPFEIGLDYYDFADEDFLGSLKNCLSSNENLIKISGAYTKETLYATLFALRSIYEDDYLDKIKIIDDTSLLGAIDASTFEGPSVFVAVVDDCDDDVPIVDGCINIHITSPLSGNETIKLRRRTRKSSIEALKRVAKMDVCDASSIIDKVGNCFPFFFRKMYRVDPNKKAKILKAIDKKNIALSLLYNGWNESFQGDREVLERNSGVNYQTFLDQISPIELIEDPFIKEKKGFFKQGVFVISVDEQWGLFEPLVSDTLVQHFFIEAFKIITNYLIGPLRFYSKTFVFSLFETMAFLSKYKKGSEKLLTAFFEKLLGWVSRHRQYEGISPFLRIMAESTPDFLLTKLENNIKRKAGFYRLFTEDNSYADVLWALESLMFFESTSCKAAKVVFELCKINRKYPTSNAPADTMHRILAAWTGTTPLSQKQKEDIAKWMMKNNRGVAWPIIESLQFKGNDYLAFFNEPTIRQSPGFSKQPSTEEIWQLFKAYYDLCFANARTPQEWCALIDDYSFIYFGEEEPFFEKLVYQASLFTDVEKYIIKRCLDSLVFKHKYHSCANWSLPVERLQPFEKASESISFSEKEFEFVTLFEKRVFFPNPTAFSMDNDDYRRDNEQKKDSFVEDQFCKFQEKGLSLNGLYCCVKKAVGVGQIDGDRLIRLAQLIRKHVTTDVIYIELLEAFKGRVDFKISYDPLIDNDAGSNTFSAFLGWIYKNDRRDVFNDFMSSVTIDVENENFLGFYKSIEPSFIDDFWKNTDNFPRMNTNSGTTVRFCLEKLYEQGNGVYIEVLFFYKDKDLLSFDELFEFFFKDKVIQMLKNSTIQFEASEILDKFEKQYKDSQDTGVLEKIIRFELVMGGSYGEQRYPALNNVLSRSPDLYVDYLERVYFGGKRINNPLVNKLHYYFFAPKFAPGFVSGSFDERIFTEWVNRFKDLLSKHNGWERFFYDSLGKMFVNYPYGPDSLPLPAPVRKFIEKVNPGEPLKDLKIAYYCGVNNFRVRTVTDGSPLLKEAKRYASYAEKLKGDGYIQTASIFEYLVMNLSKEADDERDAAVDE